jgi:hypothetical protein
LNRLETSGEGVAVSVPGLPGCHSQGGTEEEALENIADYLAVVDELSRNKPSRCRARAGLSNDAFKALL